MTIRTKLIAIITLSTVGLIFVSGSNIVQSMGTASKIADLKAQAELATYLSAVVHESQKERGLTAGYYGSEGTAFQTELSKQRKVVDERIASLLTYLDTIDLDSINSEVAGEIDEAQSRFGKLGSVRGDVDGMSIPLGNALGYYTGNNALLIDTIGLMNKGNESAELAGAIGSYVSFLNGKERAGIERAVLSNTFAKDAFGPGMFKKYVSLVTQQDTYLREFRRTAGPEMLAAYENGMKQDVIDGVLAYRKLAEEKASTGGFETKASDWFAASTARINLLKQVEDRLSEVLVASANHLHAEARASVFYGIVFTGIMLLIVSVSCFFCIRSITRPIDQLIVRLRDIAEGEGDLTQRVDAERSDELGVLGGWFNAFIDKMHGVIVQAAQVSREASAAANQVAATTQQMAGGLEDQRRQVSSVSASVEEMSATVIEVARQSSEANQSADRAGQQAREGGDVVANAVSTIQRIADVVNDSASAVGSLGSRAEQIGQVIDVINDIAEQTNLLALNAAIEAARAGEHGRGFAVVADEVRKLAERTSQATEEVTQSIKTIQDETNVAVERMQTGTSSVVEGVSQAEQAGDSLKQIVTGSRDVASLIQGIASATEEQSTATDDIARNVEIISGVTNQSAEGASQMAVAAEQLSQRISDLDDLISQFKVDETLNRAA